MIEIKYVKGDATAPLGEGPKVIANVCNDVGAWGRGFVLAITERWPHVERAYRRWFQDSPSTFKLGETRFVEVPHPGGLTWVANMIGQHGIFDAGGAPPIRYDAIETCLASICKFAKFNAASVHMPRIGCGLAGGTWADIGPLVEKTLSQNDIAVTVYDYAPSRPGDRAYVPAQIEAAAPEIMAQKIGALRSRV